MVRVTGSSVRNAQNGQEPRRIHLFRRHDGSHPIWHGGSLHGAIKLTTNMRRFERSTSLTPTNDDGERTMLASPDPFPRFRSHLDVQLNEEIVNLEDWSPARVPNKIPTYRSYTTAESRGIWNDIPKYFLFLRLIPPHGHGTAVQDLTDILKRRKSVDRKIGAYRRLSVDLAAIADHRQDHSESCD